MSELYAKFEHSEKAMAELRRMIHELGLQHNHIANNIAQLTQMGLSNIGTQHCFACVDHTETIYFGNPWLGKVEFPRFNGTDFANWLYHWKRFFEFENTLEDAKLRLVVIQLEGNALQWHRAFLRSRRTRH